MAAHKFLYRELDMHRARAPGEVRQAALVVPMHRRRGHATARAVGGRHRRRELEDDVFLLHSHLGAAHGVR